MPRDYSLKTGKNNPNYKGGYAINKNSLYNSWQNMKGRCLRPKNPKYPRYGGRGIMICSEWLDGIKFFEWSLANGYQDGYSIDRIDNDGNYEPSNCRWVSISENSRHKRTTKISHIQAEEIRQRISNGENECDLAREFNVVHGTIWFIKNNFTHVPEGECSRTIKAGK